MTGEISETERKINELLNTLGNYEGQQHEELREYFLTKDELPIIEDYFRRLAEVEGLAINFSEGTYFVSRRVYGDPILACFDEEDVLHVIGDSLALGEMKTDMEKNLEEILLRKTPLKTQKNAKAVEGLENMGLL